MNIELVERLKRNKEEQLDEMGILIVDMQRGFLTNLNIEDREKTITHQVELIKDLSSKKVPVTFLEYVDFYSNIGKTDERLLLAAGKYNIFEKSSQNGFTNPSLKEHFLGQGIKRLIFGGIYSRYCVKGTMHGALEAGFIPYISDKLVANKKYEESLTDDIDWFKGNSVFSEDYRTFF